MLKLILPELEAFDNGTQEFKYFKEKAITLEHSLLSISKWESIWHKPYLSTEKFTEEEIMSYVECMVVTPDSTEELRYRLTEEHVDKIVEYIKNPMTATTFNDLYGGPKKSKVIITSELIYYNMVAYNIPFECQKWHINRLLTLIRICNIKNSPDKKMSTSEVMKRNTQLNEARKKKLNTKG